MKLLDTAGVSTLWGKVKDHVKTSIDSQQFKTINGTSVKGAGDIQYSLATSTNDGLMKASDKAKLDSIAVITDAELKSILV